MSQYEFRKNIALHWIAPVRAKELEKKAQKFQIHRKSSSPSVASLSSMSMDSLFAAENARRRCVRTCDDTLEETGALRCRLDTTLCHLPIKPQSKKAKCAIHRWVGVEKQAQILHCPTCNMHLCVECYGLFHKTPNLVSMKKNLEVNITQKMFSLSSIIV